MPSDLDDKRDQADREVPDRGSGASDGGNKPANVAPDAVKDPTEKTGGKPGVPSDAGDGETDPGSS